MNVVKGDAVLLHGYKSNGDESHPALVTRVYATPDNDTDDKPVGVNIIAFPDMGSPKLFGSIYVYSTVASGVASGDKTFCTPA